MIWSYTTCSASQILILFWLTLPAHWRGFAPINIKIHENVHESPRNISQPIQFHENQLSQSKPMKLILNFCWLNLQEISNTESTCLRPGRWQNWAAQVGESQQQLWSLGNVPSSRMDDPKTWCLVNSHPTINRNSLPLTTDWWPSPNQWLNLIQLS